MFGPRDVQWKPDCSKVFGLADTDGIWEVPDEEIVSHAGSN
jgi:hypothetical protein